MGYAPCFVDGFANFAQWYEHMRKVHTDLIESVTAFGKTDILQELSVKALADGKQWHVQRRAMDPRLRNAAAVSVEPPAPQA